jgi:outer membrane protein OmpA-like peptidoglycan-associated protein
MRTLFTASAALVSFCSLAFPEPAAITPMPRGYYIVVGAFAVNKEALASRFVESVNKKGNHATYGLDTKRNLLLIYLDQYTDFNESIRQMEQVRVTTSFTDAWVRIVKDVADVVDQAQPPETRAPEVGLPAVDQPRESQDLVVVQNQPKKDSVAIVVSNTATVIIGEEERKEETSVRKTAADVKKGPPTLANTKVFFNLWNSQDSKLVDGDIEIIDVERSRLIREVKGKDTISIPDPKSNSGTLMLICDSFGYRKVQYEINYKDPLGDTSKHYMDLEGDYFVVHFEMIRYHKGDIGTLYNVYFYNDAAIMQQESKYELDKLLDMLKANPRYRVMLHGHTNGMSRGPIREIGPSKDFFNLNAADIKNGSGSSKDLSLARATVIRDWLVSNGIAENRMEIKAWGGSRMLHDKNSVHARKNVRVEVEVLEE